MIIYWPRSRNWTCSQAARFAYEEAPGNYGFQPSLCLSHWQEQRKNSKETGNAQGMDSRSHEAATRFVAEEHCALIKILHDSVGRVIAGTREAEPLSHLAAAG
jgi:hypothetical protein